MSRVIGNDHVATVKRLAKRNRADAKAKRPQVNRDVRRVDDKLAVWI